MKKMLVLYFVFCLFTDVFAQANIKIGSFNIANLGDTDEYRRSLISLVNIMRKMDADLICIQEVEPNNLGKAQVTRLVGLLNKAARFYNESTYDVALSPVSGDERTAYLWRKPITIESEITLIDHEIDPDLDNKKTFQRVPSVALFKAGNYDFYAINCHLYTKINGNTSEGRTEEYKALVKWLKNVALEEEKDAIVVGDFNRFLDGQRYPKKTAWGDLMTTDHAEYFRFPLLEAIKNDVPSFDPTRDSAPSDQFSTTTSKRRSIYEQILISKGSYREFTQTPKLNEDVGIVDFDNEKEYEWFVDDWTTVSAILSDHRPVWIRIKVDQPDDD